MESKKWISLDDQTKALQQVESAVDKLMELWKDDSITRTTRLFYVACTRAQKSLAIIAYTYDCEAVKATAMKNNWFEDDEIRLLE